MARRKRPAPKRRSGFEDRVEASLKAKGVRYKYEPKTYEVWVETAVRGAVCRECGHTKFKKKQTYTPDFVLSNGVHIEAKGRLTVDNRRKYLAFVEQYPGIKFRLLFQRDNPITKGSKTKYSDWCTKNGIEYSIGEEVPDEWTH